MRFKKRCRRILGAVVEFIITDVYDFLYYVPKTINIGSLLIVLFKELIVNPPGYSTGVVSRELTTCVVLVADGNSRVEFQFCAH